MTDPYKEWLEENGPRPDNEWERFQAQAKEADRIRRENEEGK